MTEPPHTNLTRSLSTFKSKLSSKFKNSAGNEVDSNNGSVDENGILAMKYDDFNKELADAPEMRPSASFTNLNNHELIQSSRNGSIDAGHPIDSLSSTPPPTSSAQQSSNTSPSHFSLKEKEFSFLQLQNTSAATSPVTSRREDSIIDPLNTSIMSEKLNMAVTTDIISPQPRSIQLPPMTHNNSVSSTSRKSSNISASSWLLPPLQQPVTPTNETSMSNGTLEAQSLELADAMALSILDKVDAGIKIDQNVETEWKI